jgi:hypothetical protein
MTRAIVTVECGFQYEDTAETAHLSTESFGMPSMPMTGWCRKHERYEKIVGMQFIQPR